MSGSGEFLRHMDHRAFQVFNKEDNLNRRSVKGWAKKALTPVGYDFTGFVKAKGTKTPFDGDITYWAARNSKHYDGPLAKILGKQNHICVYCNQHLLDNEKVYLHHVKDNY